MREYVFAYVLTPDTVCISERLKMTYRKDVVLSCQMCFIPEVVCLLLYWCCEFFFYFFFCPNSTSFMLAFCMIIAFCIFSLKGTIE